MEFACPGLPPCSAEQQAVCQAVVAEGRHARVQAEAGGGKTTLFLYVAVNWLRRRSDAEAQAKVLLLSYNVALAADTTERVARLGLQDGIDVATVHSMLTRLYGTAVNDTISLRRALAGKRPPRLPDGAEYGLVLLDEAQDNGQDLVDGLNALLGVLDAARTRVVVVGDQRQELYQSTRESGVNLLHDPAHLLHAAGAPQRWADFHLHTSFRLTPSTCRFVNRFFRHPDQPEIVAGNHVSADRRPLVVVGRERDGHVLQTLQQLVAEFGVDHVMVCCYSVRSGVCIRLCQDASAQLGLRLYSTHKPRSQVSPALMANKLRVSTFHQSKGSERRCVLVLGLEPTLFDLIQQPLEVDPETGMLRPPNAVHVGVTRARDRLVIFQDVADAPWPTLWDLDAVAECAEVRNLLDVGPQRPLRTAARPGPRYRTFTAAKLATFATAEVLTHAADVARLTFERLGDAVAHRPTATTTFTATAADTATTDPTLPLALSTELVCDLFPAAVTAAIARTLYRRMGVPRNSPLEDALRGGLRRPEQLPPLFREFYRRWQPHGDVSGVREYLMLSALHENCVRFNTLYELRQLPNFDWVGEDEHAYFAGCVDHAVAALSSLYEHGGDFDRVLPFRRQEEFRVRVTATADFLPRTDDAREFIVWFLRYDADVSESTLLEALVTMWVRSARRSAVLLVPENKVVTIRVDTLEDLDAFMYHLLVTKTHQDPRSAAAAEA